LKAARIGQQPPTPEEELDFNSRESSRSRGEEGFNIGNATHVNETSKINMSRITDESLFLNKQPS
jgi:hypothetical protein